MEKDLKIISAVGKKEIQYIKETLMQALEEVDVDGIVTGEYICHADILGAEIKDFDDSFTVCSDEKKPTYLVAILEVNEDSEEKYREVVNNK